MAALVFPTAAQAAAQTPLNTFSPTSTPLANTSNSFTYVYDTVLGVWTGQAGGGGGGGLTAATLAEAAAGTINTKANTPETSVPKDAAGMTGAALLPKGTTAQRPAAPVSGMTRLNTDTSPQLEVYNGSAWAPIGVITSNLTLNVATTGNDVTGLGTAGAPWATPHRAMEYLSQYAIKQGVTVTVSVADGTYTFTTPLNLNHPNGSQIFINGGTTTGARPTTSLTGGNAVGNTGATLAANDTLLNAYYNTKWQFNGCHGLVCDSGGNVSVNTVLIRGNAAGGYSGVISGNYNGVNSLASSGGINLGSTVAVHNFGDHNIVAARGGSIEAGSVTSTNAGVNGIHCTTGGTIDAPSAVSANCGNGGFLVSSGGAMFSTSATAQYNSGVGFGTFNGGSIDATSSNANNNAGGGVYANIGGAITFISGTATANSIGVNADFSGTVNAQSSTVNSNTGYGVASVNGGSVNASSATIQSNGNVGIYCDMHSIVNLFSGNCTGNGAGNIFANRGSDITVQLATIGASSPPVGTIGNGNSLITN